MDLKLEARVWAHARGEWSHGYWTALTINAKGLEEFGMAFPITSGDKRNCEVTFTVPPCGPTLVMPQGAAQFFVTLSMKYGLKSCRIKLPVMVQPSTPYYLQDFPANYVYQTMPKTPNTELIASTQDIIAPWWAFCEMKK